MVPTVLAPGVVVDGRYEIIRELGQGGMGAVYEAQRLGLEKRVALKVMQADLALSTRGKHHERFLREARIASSITHPNVVDTIDFGDLDEHSTYSVMELLPGRNLSALLAAEGPQPWSRVGPWLRQVLGGLAAAHGLGIVHRDIKAANIMLLDQPDEWGNEWVKVLDFGIAKLQEADAQSQALTGTSELLGTASHMAPELVRGAPPDARTDLYALGITAYQLLTGAVPFHSENMFKLLSKQISEAPISLREHLPDLPEAVDAFVLRALDKDPARRHQSASAMADALDALEHDAPEDDALELAQTMMVDSGDVEPKGTQLLPSHGTPGGTPGGTPVGTEVLPSTSARAASPSSPRRPSAPSRPAGDRVAGTQLAAHAPAAAPRRAAPVGAPTPGPGQRSAGTQLATSAPATLPHRAPPARRGVPTWMILIPVIAIAAGIVVGLFT